MQNTVTVHQLQPAATVTHFQPTINGGRLNITVGGTIVIGRSRPAQIRAIAKPAAPPAKKQRDNSTAMPVATVRGMALNKPSTSLTAGMSISASAPAGKSTFSLKEMIKNGASSCAQAVAFYGAGVMMSGSAPAAAAVPAAFLTAAGATCVGGFIEGTLAYSILREDHFVPSAGEFREGVMYK